LISDTNGTLGKATPLTKPKSALNTELMTEWSAPEEERGGIVGMCLGAGGRSCTLPVSEVGVGSWRDGEREKVVEERKDSRWMLQS
jgi:hypothetical protein